MIQAQSFLDNDRDKPRNRGVLDMKVHNRSARALCLPDGNVIPPGEHQISVYEDSVPAVMALVEPTPEAIKTAEDAYKLELAKAVITMLDGCTETPAQVRKRIQAGDASIADEVKRAEAVTPHSMQGMFQQLNGRDLLPLVSASVVEGSEKLEPQKERELLAARRAAEAMRGYTEHDLNAAVAAGIEKALKARKG